LIVTRHPVELPLSGDDNRRAASLRRVTSEELNNGLGDRIKPVPETGSHLLLEETELLGEEELWRDDDDVDHAGWYCVATSPFPCPAAGCDFVAEFMTAAHLILVWEQRDDPNLLRHAERAKHVGRDPRVVSYEQSFGPSASYYAWEAAGRPVHGVRGRS
jgi:hypothetical protein